MRTIGWGITILITSLFSCKKAEKEHLSEPTLASSDTLLLAALISSECYCNDIEDMYRVGSVVLNRIEDEEFPNTLFEVIFQKNKNGKVQFDGVGKFNFTPTYCDSSISVSRRLLERGSVLDNGIKYYYNPKITGTTSNWCRKMMNNTVLKGLHHHYAAF